jgi:hypothetical protein
MWAESTEGVRVKRTLKGLTALFAVVAVSVVVATTAFAVKAPHVKVDVCHATASQTNPYVLITVNVNSVGVANDLNGHAGHEGDIWASFVFDGVTYPGQGDQSILENGCSVPNGPPALIAVTPVPPVPTPATCDDPEQITLVQLEKVEGVDYTPEGEQVGPGHFKVTFFALNGYVIADGAQTVFEFDLTGPLTGLQCNNNNGGPPKGDHTPAISTGVSNQQLIKDSGSRVQGG